MRKRRMGAGESNGSCNVDDWIRYVERRNEVRDVVLSGGDPLMLKDEVLDGILSRLRRIPHLEIIRINTRSPVTLPERITPDLCGMLKQYHPLYVITHFNHPAEITLQSKEACVMLADTGIPLGNQTVLLKGVNDDPGVMKKLMQKLLTVRVRPYYIHHADPVRGTAHFRTSVSRGLDILKALRGHTTGLAVPYYMIDLPGGKGKVPVLPEDVERRGNTLLIRSYQGEVVEYTDIE